MRFYDCTPAPSPRRARIFIAEKGLEIETIQIDLRGGEQMTPEFRIINPRCTVPVLVLDDGTAITENAGIASYLVIVYVMEMEFTLYPVAAISTVLGSLVITLLFGLLNTWRALGEKPAAVLRQF